MSDAFDLISADEFITGRKPKKAKRRNRKQQRADAKRNTDYTEYIHSEKWKAFRLSIIVARGKKCEQCGRTGRVELHHKHYFTFKNERPEDVELLCFRCHGKADEKRKSTPLKRLRAMAWRNP